MSARHGRGHRVDQSQARGRKVAQGTYPWEVALSAVTKAELYFGARNSERVEHNLSVLRRFFAPFASVAFDDRAAEEYGVIRADLQRAGALIGPNDLLIAALARSRDLTLVSLNVREFGAG